MYDLVQVWFKRPARGRPYFLSYGAKENGFVRPDVAEQLVKDGIAEYVSIPKPQKKEEAFTSTPAPDVTPAMETQAEEGKWLTFDTVDDVLDFFGDDVGAMRQYADENDIYISARAKKPETVAKYLVS